MEVLEAKSASRRARFWACLSDPDKRPRIWWFPPSSRRDDVLRMPEAARQDYQKVVQQAHEKFSETVRLAMLSLLGFGLFCLLITFSTPDSTLLVADPTIKMPFADVQVSFQSFLILAPFLLIIITLYLHIFYGYWLDLEADYQHLTLSRKSSAPSIERLPTLFSLDHPVPRCLTAFIFYWLVPLVLIVITWKGAARVEWGVPLVLFTVLVTVALVFLQIRRRPASQRQWNRPFWAVMGLIVGGTVAITVPLVPHPGRPRVFSADISELVVVPQWLPRPLNIFRADLKGKWLVAVNLQGAYASFANLEGAELDRANLQSADLQGADLQGADLRDAKLRGADFMGANLRGADLQGADLRDANLWGADLQGANLQGLAVPIPELAKLFGPPEAKFRFRDGVLIRRPNAVPADLQATNLEDAVLWGANLREAMLEEAQLRGADLGGAKLAGADLQGADLGGAKLTGADLQGADLGGAKLWGANLQGANLGGAKLAGADLEGANLHDTDLRNANLKEVKNLTEEQIQSAQIDARTRLPDYLKNPIP